MFINASHTETSTSILNSSVVNIPIKLNTITAKGSDKNNG